MNVWDEVSRLLEKYDADIHIDCASESAWGGQLRLTLTNPSNAPSRSITFHSVGGQNPNKVARRLLDDAKVWLADSGVEPLPVPDWMKDD
jgi:hypothetical protein